MNDTSAALPALKVPQQQRLLLAHDEWIEIVHAAGRDRDASCTAATVQGNVLSPTVAVNPSGAMNHQGSVVSRLVVNVHPLQAEAASVAIAVFFRHEETPEGRALTAWPVAKTGSPVSTAVTWAMHHIGAGNNLLFPKVPHKQTRLAGGNGVVNEQRVMFVHLVASCKGQSLASTLLNGFILTPVGNCRKPVVFPCPMDSEGCGSKHHQQHSPKNVSFLFPLHHFSMSEAAVRTTMDTHSNAISAIVIIIDRECR